MPFAGPGGRDRWWYGENATAGEIQRYAAMILRQGGGELCASERIVRELRDWAEDEEPP